MKPFLKWAGGKRQLLNKIVPLLPDFTDYHEPFLGGGSLYFHLQPTYSILSDLNEELINCYQNVQCNVENVIDVLDNWENTHETFEKVRGMDRDADWSLVKDDVKAARFIFLNRTCYNGLYRVNRNGQFNVPYGKYKTRKPVNYELLRNCSERLSLEPTIVQCNNYKGRLFDMLDENSFVYFDPPYLPLSDTSNFTSYTQFPFGQKEHTELALYVKRLTERGVKCMVSNCDHPFIRNLYKDFNIHTVEAKRNINCVASKRKPITELIITNYETNRKCKSF